MPGLSTATTSASMTALKFSTTLARALNTEIQGPPSYSSTNNTRDVVHSLPLRVKLNLLLTGKGNRALPAGYLFNLDRHTPDLIGAVSLFTQLLSKRDFLAMKPLVTEDCMRELRKLRMQEKQRSQTIVSPDEVFFSFVSDVGKSENDFNLVIMYKPTFPKIKDQMGWTTNSYKGYGDIIKQRLKAPLLMLFRRNNENKDNPSESKYWNMMRTNPIVIANVRFSRKDDRSDWMISRAGQVNTRKVWRNWELSIWDLRLWVSMLKETQPEWKKIREVQTKLSDDSQQESDYEKKIKMKFTQKIIKTPPSSSFGNVLQTDYLMLISLLAVFYGGPLVLVPYMINVANQMNIVLPAPLGNIWIVLYALYVIISFKRVLGNWRFVLNFNLSNLKYFFFLEAFRKLMSKVSRKK